MLANRERGLTVWNYDLHTQRLTMFDMINIDTVVEGNATLVAAIIVLHVGVVGILRDDGAIRLCGDCDTYCIIIDGLPDLRNNVIVSDLISTLIENLGICINVSRVGPVFFSSVKVPGDHAVHVDLAGVFRAARTSIVRQGDIAEDEHIALLVGRPNVRSRDDTEFAKVIDIADMFIARVIFVGERVVYWDIQSGQVL